MTQSAERRARRLNTLECLIDRALVGLAAELKVRSTSTISGVASTMLFGF